MNKTELIKLAKELSTLEDLKGREADLSFLKREWQRLNNREEETFYEQQLTNEFNSYYEIIAKKEGSLFSSSYDEKKALVARAKELVARNDVMKASKELDEVFKSFKAAGRCTKEQDDELWGEFKAIKDEMNKKRNEYFENLKVQNDARKAQKEALVEKAKEILNVENIKNASAQMDALMEEWKKVGFAGKENDEALWAKFSEVRKEFSKKRKEHFENMKNVYAERVQKKEDLIKAVKKLVADADWSENELKLIKGFRSEWKTIGFAGKDNEDALWEEFNKAINQYFEEKKFYNN